MSGDKIVRVTNQGELDEALKADPSDDVVIVIDSNPGKYVPIFIFVGDSRGHIVEACGESRVIAYGTSRLTARGHSIVDAQDEATVYATDYAKVDWHDDSSGECGYYASGQVWDRAVVRAHGSCPLFAFDNSTVTAVSGAHVVARYEASVIAHHRVVVEISGDVDVTAHDQVIVYSEGGEVYAHDHVTVYAKYDTRVEGPATSAVHVLTPGVRVVGDITVIDAAPTV